MFRASSLPIISACFSLFNKKSLTMFGKNKEPVNTKSLTDGRDDCQRVEERSREGPVISLIQIVLPIITFLQSEDDLLLVSQQLFRYIFLPVFLKKKMSTGAITVSVIL
jgi:hypothetical protein